MFDFKIHVQDFFSGVAKGDVEIYNEFSLQHEFGSYLRSTLGPTLKTQFERPVSFFGLTRSAFVKKEIDVSVFTPDRSRKFAFELKYPRNGQYPEQMFKACQDICFVEQLCHSGFITGFFVMVADDPLFYEGKTVTGLYQHFRGTVPVHGVIQKPTGKKDDTVEVKGNYRIIWNTVNANLKYALVEVGR